MKDGMMKGVATGLLMGAGALWAFGSMNRGQKQRVAKYAAMAADKMAKKAGDILK